MGTNEPLRTRRKLCDRGLKRNWELVPDPTPYEKRKSNLVLENWKKGEKELALRIPIEKVAEAVLRPVSSIFDMERPV